MKKILASFLSVLLLLTSAACGAKSESVPDASEAPSVSEEPVKEDIGEMAFDEDALLADAESVADALQRGSFAEIVEKFDATMAAALDAEALGSGWDAAVGAIGNYIERASVEGAASGNHYAVNVAEKYEKSGLQIHIVYDASGRIAGLQCVYIDLTLPASTDDYTEIALTLGEGTDYPLPALLTLPTGTQTPPVVIFVHGSGASDKNENVNGNKPFEDLAHGLAEHGVASLRFDKRYFVYPEAASDLSKVNLRGESLDDTSLAIALMQADSRVDGKNIYVLGHSLGGMLAPAIAVEHPELKGVISMAGSLRPLWEILYDQNMEMVSALDRSAMPAEQLEQLDSQLEQLDADLATLRGDFSALPDAALLMGIQAGYWKSLSEYSGMNFIGGVKMPMLILQGAADFQVYPEKDYALWQDTLAGRDNVTFHLYDGLNHLMMPTQGKRDTSEYAVVSHVDGQVISDIAEFVVNASDMA